jgi:Methyltransferase domain
LLGYEVLLVESLAYPPPKDAMIFTSHLPYYYHRASAGRFEKRNPDKPWLNFRAIEAFETVLRPTDVMIECGSGRSTLWFSKRVGSLLSIENDPRWHAEVSARLGEAGCQNVDYRLVEYSYEGKQDENEYLQVLNRVPDSTVDVALVDGGPRSFCCVALLPKIRVGGILAIDDAQVALPSKSSVPNSVRTVADIPTVWNGNTELCYPELFAVIESWPSIWLSDGVKDTAFYIKPQD